MSLQNGDGLAGMNIFVSANASVSRPQSGFYKWFVECNAKQAPTHEWGA